MTGGELFDRIAKKLAYTENEARNVMFDLLNALEHCHKNKIMHRGTRIFLNSGFNYFSRLQLYFFYLITNTLSADLKPENLLLASEDENASVKLADFGLAGRLYSINETCKKLKLS